jgi:ATP-dependent DNA helicase DinG
MPRGALLDWFRSTPNAVLFATSSFWEGVDVPGQALSCVIIDKMPFSRPDEPVVQATTDALKREGRDWFSEYSLPKAILLLKQGFGRLIRSRTDKGVVALCDPRLLVKPYGKTVVWSLPPARRIFRLDRGDVANLLAEPEEEDADATAVAEAKS